MNPLLSGREILVVEDEPILRKRVTRFLESEGASVTAAAAFAEGKNALESISFDYALLDNHLPDGLGIDLLDFAKGVVCVMVTADGGWEVAVEAIKRGASDYIAKPFELQEIPLILSRCARDRRNHRSRQHRLDDSVKTDSENAIFFGDSLSELKGQLENILAADRRLESRLPPVLLEGETGTGKSTIARWIHANGPRKNSELVVVNCAALPENLAESELFGHEKGSFTDAKEKRIGLFEAADGGTLFLDEIGSLSPGLQAKVLVAIEAGKIRRVGGVREIVVDPRIIAASNRDLVNLVEEGAFREDLYHRLNLLRARIPPLRERGKDILMMAEHLAERIALRYGRDSYSFTEDGKRQLLAYDWPGNIRELSHEIERAFILGEPDKLEFPAIDREGGSEGSNDLSTTDWLNPSWEFPDSGFQLEAAIDRMIEKAIKQTDGNVSQAARLLGVSRDYIRYRKGKKKSSD